MKIDVNIMRARARVTFSSVPEQSTIPSIGWRARTEEHGLVLVLNLGKVNKGCPLFFPTNMEQEQVNIMRARVTFPSVPEQSTIPSIGWRARTKEHGLVLNLSAKLTKAVHCSSPHTMEQEQASTLPFLGFHKCAFSRLSLFTVNYGQSMSYACSGSEAMECPIYLFTAN